MNKLQDVSNTASSILEDAFDAKATDIHFHPRDQSVSIYFRILGTRHFYKSFPKEIYHQILLYFKYSSGMDIGEQNLPQNGTMNFSIDKNRVYFLRLSTLPTKVSESLAIRILPQFSELRKDNLFLFPSQFKNLISLFSNNSGLILFSGLTGSGKTTTMYTILEEVVNRNKYQVVTLEDPIEKSIPNILQVEINDEIGLTYHNGLKAVLRHDPDIILIGEILDEETAKFAVHAALTGHIVLSTVHAKDAQSTIRRLLSMDIQKIDLLETLLAVVSLKLIPITTKNHTERRAAIAEILTGSDIKSSLLGKRDKSYTYLTFDQLRKKAYAYGFLKKKYFNF